MDDAGLERASGAHHCAALALSELADARIEAATGNVEMFLLKQAAARRLLADALAALAGGDAAPARPTPAEG